MNCNTCRFELSQCLDGRLPSGRRAIVMQHATGCEECSTFWSELQAAQQLTLQLPKPGVGEGFREQLWERIRAGEGTPEAVFHEPVPVLTKVRYALTGAVAAAAVLMFATWLRDDRSGSDRAGGKDETNLAIVGSGSRDGRPGSETRDGGGAARMVSQEPASDVDQVPLLTSAQPLTAGLFAIEAAKGFEQRCLTANHAIAQIGRHAGITDELMVRQVFDNAIEARDLGAALLELSDRRRLMFSDAEVYGDLRVAVNMLNQIDERNVATVRSIIEPALARDRLSNIARVILLQPSLDPHEEQDVLVRVNTRNPQILPMLFFSFGPNDEICEQFGLFRKVGVFVLDDQCGRSYVAPRSQVDAGSLRLQVVRRVASGGQQIEVEFQPGKKK